ncbi:MAG: glucosyltransferase domain-containing protein [Faecalibacterium sp.]|jgi:hypothetical protein|nr:glucosyltransferase domain-containing protein [Faecalibacterium sp.]
MQANETALFSWRPHFRREWVACWLTVWVSGFLAHGYRMANFLLNGDGSRNLCSPGASLIEGRCFLDLAAALRSRYSAPWLCGVVALFWLSLALTLLIELFSLRSLPLVVLASAFLATCPTLTASFVYLYTADCYMLAFLLVVAAVFLSRKYPPWGCVAGAVCICLSIGIYQAYVTVALSLIVMLAILELFQKQSSVRVLCVSFAKEVVMVLAGGLLYKLVLTLFLHFTNTALIDYQGINKVGILSLWQYYLAVLKTLDKLLRAFGLESGPFASWNSALNFILLLLLAAATVLLLIQKRLYRRLPALLILLLLTGALFVVPFAVNFVSPAVQYHALMELGVWLLYFQLLVYLQEIHWAKPVLRSLGLTAVAALVVLTYHNTVNANIAYYIMQFNYEKSYYVASDVLSQLRRTEGFSVGSSKVAVIGYWPGHSSARMGTDPVLVGLSDDSFLDDQSLYLNFWDASFGIQVQGASPEEISAIEQSPAYQAMPCYPESAAVQQIDGIYVVKLSEDAG